MYLACGFAHFRFRSLQLFNFPLWLYLWEFRVFFPARLPEESDRYGRGWDGLFVIANRRVKECAVSAPTCGRGRRKGGTDQVHFDDRN